MTITKNVWKAAALLLILCLVSAVMISGTYAKYTNTYAGEDTALVAKWEIDGTGGIFNTTGTGINLDLFSHAYSQNVRTSNGAMYIIAPGVAGDFTIAFDNNSDVAANVTFDIAATSGSAIVPIKYGFTSSDVTHDITWLKSQLNNNITSTFAAIGVDAPAATQIVYWEWPFGTGVPADDLYDTNLGIASSDSDAASHGRTQYGLTITATAIQVQPTTTP